MSITSILQVIRKASKAKDNAAELHRESSFFHFIWKEKTNRRFIKIMLVGTIIQFIIFKLFYPFADFFSDSYSYIYAASANLDINIWPIGYSKFLRWFHFITYSDTALITFQYFFLELSCLYFFFTILYFYRPVKTNQIILFIFLFFNPLFLYISNYVNSDPMFIALSVLWFTELLWILQRPNLNHILIHGILLFFCFTVRNNAYIYPFVTVIAFVLSRLRILMKVSGASLGILLIIPFIIHTREAAYKLTGTRQFSLFTGWQLANNALYMYEYTDTARHFNSPQLKELDKLSTKFYGVTPKDFYESILYPNPGNYFIQFTHSPLKMYLSKHFSITDDQTQITAWGKSSVIFSLYGKSLITHNPAAYFWQFMIPNTKNFFLPKLEKLKTYNLGQKEVNSIAQQWFKYKTNKVTSISSKAQGYILYIFPWLFLSINIYMLFFILILVNRKQYQILLSQFNRTLLLTCTFWFANFAFCISTTIIVYRYQVFPLIISTLASLLLIELVDKKVNNNLQTKEAKELSGSKVELTNI